jgi:hypothetical protein
MSQINSKNNSKKIILTWFNFGCTTTFIPSGNNIDVHLSIYTTELLDLNIGNEKCVCSCCEITKRTINSTKTTTSRLKIKNIRTNNQNIVNFNVGIFYDFLKDVIEREYRNFHILNNHKNIAICIDSDQDFNVLEIFSSFTKKLKEHHYEFMTETDDDSDDDDDHFPFMQIDDKVIESFKNWVKVVCPIMT